MQRLLLPIYTIALINALASGELREAAEWFAACLGERPNLVIPRLIDAVFLTGKWVTWLTGYIRNVRGLHLNRCKMFRPRPNMCKLRRALSEYPSTQKRNFVTEFKLWARVSPREISTFSRRESELQIELQIKDFSLGLWFFFTEAKHDLFTGANVIVFLF